MGSGIALFEYDVTRSGRKQEVVDFDFARLNTTCQLRIIQWSTVEPDMKRAAVRRRLDESGKFR
jgi:hypothetical protein